VRRTIASDSFSAMEGYKLISDCKGNGGLLALRETLIKLSAFHNRSS